MKILLDKFEKAIEYKKTWYKNKLLEDDCEEITKKLLKSILVKDCNNILQKYFGDINKIYDTSKSNFFIILESYFCHPYKIYLYDKNYKNFLNIEWEEDIFSITKEKLINILKDSGRKYLKVKMNMGFFMWSQEILEIEI